MYIVPSERNATRFPCDSEATLPDVHPADEGEENQRQHPPHECLNAFAELGVIEIVDVLDSLIEGLADKVSKVRIEVCQLLQRWLSLPKVTDKSLKDSVKPLGEALYKSINDGEVEVRNVGTAALAELVATVGRKPLNDILKKLETAEIKRYQKLDELITKSAKKAPSEGGATSSSSTAAPPVEEETIEAPKAVAAKRPATAGRNDLQQYQLRQLRPKRNQLLTAARPSSSTAASAKSKAPLGKPARVVGAAAAAPAAAEPVIEESGDGPLRRIDLGAKAARLKKEAKKIKGNFREWGGEEIEEMGEAFRALCSEELHSLLMHKDFGKQMAGIDLLDVADRDTLGCTCELERPGVEVDRMETLRRKYLSPHKGTCVRSSLPLRPASPRLQAQRR